MILTDNPSNPSPRRLWLSAAFILVGLLLALGGLFWVVYKDWRDEQRDGLIQELLWLDQSLRLHLEGHQQSVEAMQLDMPLTAVTSRRFFAAAALLQRESKEIEAVQWVGPRGAVLLDAQKRTGLQLGGDAYDALWRAERLGRSAYSPPYLGPDGKYRFDLAVPVFESGRYLGGLRLVYRMDLLLQYQVPWWLATKYHISLVDLGGKALASKFDQASPVGTLSHELSFDPPGYGVSLRAITYRAGVGLLLAGAQPADRPAGGGLAIRPVAHTRPGACAGAGRACVAARNVVAPFGGRQYEKRPHRLCRQWSDIAGKPCHERADRPVCR